MFFQLFFPESPNSFFSCYSFCYNKFFSVSFFWCQGCTFPLQNFVSQMLLHGFYLFSNIFKQLDAKQTNKQTNKGKPVEKNNSCVTVKWRLFYSSCDAKDCKYCTFLFKIYKNTVKESKRLRALSVIGLNVPCVVGKVECRKLPVVNCTHKGL